MAKTFKVGDEVSVTPGAPGYHVGGKIAGNPVLMGDKLVWPVELDEVLWVEGRKMSLRVILSHADNIQKFD